MGSSCGHCGKTIVHETIQEAPYISKQVCGCGVKKIVENADGTIKAHLVSREIPEEYCEKINTPNGLFPIALTPCPLKLEKDVWKAIKNGGDEK